MHTTDGCLSLHTPLQHPPHRCHVSRQALADAAAGEPLGDALEAADMEGAYEWALEYRYELEQYQVENAEPAAAEAAAQGKPSAQDKYLLQVGGLLQQLLHTRMHT
jgi:hypothetical protein